MKVGKIIHKDFVGAFSRLGLAVNVAGLFRFKKLKEFIIAQETAFLEARRPLVEKHAKLKEDGSFEVDDNNNIVFKDQEAMAAFIKESQALSDEQFSVPADIQISCSKHLKDCTANGHDVFLLEDCVTE